MSCARLRQQTLCLASSRNPSEPGMLVIPWRQDSPSPRQFRTRRASPMPGTNTCRCDERCKACSRTRKVLPKSQRHMMAGKRFASVCRHGDEISCASTVRVGASEDPAVGRHADHAAVLPRTTDTSLRQRRDCCKFHLLVCSGAVRLQDLAPRLLTLDSMHQRIIWVLW